MPTNFRIAVVFLFSILLFQVSFAQTPNWTNLGPIPFPVKTIGQVHGIARCSQIKFHPSDPTKMYTVSASGGLWISSDKGVNWKNLGTDHTTTTTSASIAIDPTNDQVIYWGTGDSDYYYDGVGVYKTNNGGTSWTLSNTGMGNKLVKEMIILPTQNQTVLAATSGGVYKTTNGAANWTLTLNTTGVQDLKFKPGTNGQIVYASSQNGFYRSLDAGDTWTKITSPAFIFTGDKSTRLAVSPADPNVVYIGLPGSNTVGEIYKSTDGGDTFVNARSEMTKLLAGYDPTRLGQGGYNFDIEVNPADPNELYLCAHVIWRSTDSGSTWTQQQSTYGAFLHTDQHHILFDPYVPGQLWNANDGGVWSNTANGTGEWTPMSDGIAATEIYHSANSKTDRQVMYFGTQDNGGFYTNNGKFYNNRAGDYFPWMTFDYTNNFYSESSGSRQPYPSGTSSSLNLPVSPSDARFAFTPADTNIAYYANDGIIYRSMNSTSATPSWTKIHTVPSGTIKDLQVDPTNVDRLYVFTDTPALFRSDDATTAASFVKLPLPNVSTNGSIAPIPNSNIVYLGQGTSIYRSVDKGGTWSFTTGFPSASVREVIADYKSSNEAVYAYYNLGVYYKDNTKPSWVNYSAGLPIIAGINDMDIYNDGITQGLLTISYFGRGVWQTKLVPPTSNISVAISWPANDASFTAFSTINLAATASAKSGNISKVEFYNGTTLLGTSTTSPFTFPWTGVKYGNYILTAMAYDNLGNKASSALTNITVNPICNLVTGTAFGTAPYSTGAEYDKAFDGDINTIFDASSASSGYAGLDLGTAAVVTSIRFFPRSVQLGRMVGGKFQGSNTSTSTGFVDLYTISTQPTNTWQEVSIPNTTAYRYYRYLSPTDGYCNVSEIQFCGIYNQLPTVSINTSADSTLYPSVPATVNITADAVDSDGTINKVEFYQGTALLGTDYSSPYSYSWTAVEAGTYQLTAKAYDNLSGTTTSIPFTTIIGNQKPSVSIISPDDYTSFGDPASIAIYASAADPDGTINKVAFYNGTTLLGTSTTDPYTYIWTNVPIGTYSLTAKAYDNEGAITSSSPIKVEVAFPCTQVTGTPFGSSPAYQAGMEFDKAFDGDPNTIFHGNSSNGGYAGLDLGIEKIIKAIRFYPRGTLESRMNGGKFQGSNTADFSSGVVDLYIIPSTPKPGWNEITLPSSIAIRYVRYLGPNGGWANVSDIQFCGIDNVKPTLNITAQENKTAFTAPATINTIANASDLDGTVSKVEFYTGTSLLGSYTSSPYTYKFSNLSAGNYTLIAKAYDNNGGMTTAAPFSFVVFNSADPVITFDNVTKTYGDAPFAMTASSNSSGAFTYTIAEGSSFADINANTGQLTIKGAGTVRVKVDQAAKGTYNATSAMATLTIAKKNLLVIADDKYKIIHNVNPELTVTYSGFVYTDDDASLTTQATATTAAVTNSPEGTYPIIPEGASSDNYSIVYVNGSMQVNLGNRVPSVTITSPTVKDSFISPASIAISATASDSDGLITKVEFYNGANLLGTAHSTPYSINWTDAAAGNYLITAKVTDNNDSVSISTPVTVIVKTKPTLHMTSPSDSNQLVDQGTDIPFAFAVTDPDAALVSISIYDNGTLIGTINKAPYLFNYINLNPGDHHFTINALLLDGTNPTIATVDIAGKNCNSVLWTNTANYLAGDQVNYQNTIYRALQGHINKQPDLNTSVWSNIGTCPMLGTNDLKITRKNIIYPNPCETHFNIKLTDYQGQHLKYRIVDLQGRVLTEKAMGVIDSQNYECRVRIQGYTSGTYFVSLQIDNKLVTERLIIIEKPSTVKIR